MCHKNNKNHYFYNLSMKNKEEKSKLINVDMNKTNEYLSIIKGKTVSIIGYGNQGRSQALNLKDSGINVIIGNIKDEYSDKAKKDGFQVYSISEAVKNSQVMFILIPDEIQKMIFETKITPELKKGDVIVFASGYNYFYGVIDLPSFVTVLLIAPRMIGWGVRDVFLKNEGFPVLVAIGNDSDDKAEKTLIALCIALGVFKKNGCAVRSSFKEETLVDLLSEHTWAGAILFMYRAYYEVATELGASPESVILELYASGELAEIADSMKNMGLFEQLKTHSKTSQFGQLTRGPLFASKEIKELIFKEAVKILDGTFAREWTEEQSSGEIVFNRLHAMAKEHPMEIEETKLYNRLGKKKFEQ